MAYLLQLSDELGIRFTQRDLTPDDVARADEVLLSSTPFCLLPVTRIDGQAIGNGQPGEVFGRLIRAWSESVGVDIIKQARRFRNEH